MLRPAATAFSARGDDAQRVATLHDDTTSYSGMTLLMSSSTVICNLAVRRPGIQPVPRMLQTRLLLVMHPSIGTGSSSTLSTLLSQVQITSTHLSHTHHVSNWKCHCVTTCNYNNTGSDRLAACLFECQKTTKSKNILFVIINTLATSCWKPKFIISAD